MPGIDYVQVWVSKLLCCPTLISADASGAEPAALEQTIQPTALSRKEVVQLLLQQYQHRFSFHRNSVRTDRTRQLSGTNAVRQLGHHFKLAGYGSVTAQVLQALEDLHAGFDSHDDFLRGLHLLRLVAAPGMGKVTHLCLNQNPPGVDASQ